MLWDLDRSSHQRNYFPNCTYVTGNFERCGCLSRHFTWLGVMRTPSVVAAWIRHVRACAPAGHVTVEIGLLKNAKFQGSFKKWMPFSHLSQILYELEKKSSLVTRALSAKSCARDTDSLHSCTRLRLVQEMACLYHSCKILPRKHSYPNLIPSHDLEVMSSNPDRVELGVRSTSVLSRTWTKNAMPKVIEL